MLCIGIVARRARSRAKLGRHRLGQTEIRQLDVAAAVEEEVVGLDIAVGKAEAMQRLESERRLRAVEADFRLGEHVAFHEQGHQVAAEHVYLVMDYVPGETCAASAMAQRSAHTWATLPCATSCALRIVFMA